MVKWIHEFLQKQRVIKCSVERYIWARLIKKTARLLRFWTVRKEWWCGWCLMTRLDLVAGFFFALEGFPHFKQVFHNSAC